MEEYIGHVIRVKDYISHRISDVYGKEVLVLDVEPLGDGLYEFEIEFLEHVGPYLSVGDTESGWREWEFDFPPLGIVWEV